MLNQTHDVIFYSDNVANDLFAIWINFLNDVYTRPMHASEYRLIDKFNNFIMMHPKGPSKLKKQFDKLAEPLRTKMLTYFVNNYRFSEEDTHLLKQHYDGIRSRETVVFVKKILHTSVIFTDAYGLARALYTTSSVKILYAGNFHVRKWIDFFEYMGVKPEQIDIAPEDFSLTARGRSKMVELTPNMIETIKQYI
jgi:hypothetical protein